MAPPLFQIYCLIFGTVLVILRILLREIVKSKWKKEKIVEKEKIERDSLEKVKKMIEKVKKAILVSDRINIEMMRESLGMEKKHFLDKLLDLAEEFNFGIDNDILVINKDTVGDFLDALERIYRSFDTLKEVYDKVSKHLSLRPALEETVRQHYNNITERDIIILNEDLVLILAFCIYYSVNQSGHIISMNEISSAFNSFGIPVNNYSIFRTGIGYIKYLTDEPWFISEDYLDWFLDDFMGYHRFLKDILREKGINWSIEEYLQKLNAKCSYILKNLSMQMRGDRNPDFLVAAVIFLADKLIAVEFDEPSIINIPILGWILHLHEPKIQEYYEDLLEPLFSKDLMFK